MKRILLLSDTHNYFDDSMLKFVKEADEVWHAGDWGSDKVCNAIVKHRDLRGVYGNIDGQDVRVRFPKVNEFEVEGVKVCIIHIAGNPGRYNQEARELVKKNPDIFICGHSHILKVQRVKKTGMLHINPGAAGNHGFHKIRTMVRFKLEIGRVFDLEVIELGKRGLIEGNEEKNEDEIL
jgi:putative phosphoesterase